MELTWNILRAALYCPYKAWLLAKNVSSEEVSITPQTDGTHAITFAVPKITPDDRIALTALHFQTKLESMQVSYRASEDYSIKTTSLRFSKYAAKAEKLRSDVEALLSKEKPPAFYRNPHCPVCQFKHICYEALKERDCISILAGMHPKVLDKYHKKGIYSITQLSHLFRPRRRRDRPYKTSVFLWELKSLAIKEQKTFVLQPPELVKASKAIYIDFEGLPDKNWSYLIGGIIQQDGQPEEVFSFWADSREDEKENFKKLFTLFRAHPDAQIYHYGSYETKILKSIAKKFGGVFKQEFPAIEKRMVNVLSYLRTHVYPPTYSNGLKEVAGFLNFQWHDQNATGLGSIEWRKKWEETKDTIWKQKLIQYNLDDCTALERVLQWFRQLTAHAELENVQQVAEMKKQGPYKFQENIDYNEDYTYINKAGYFDYQRKKIYWRNHKALSKVPSLYKQNLSKDRKKGVPVWQPKKVHEVIVLPPPKHCQRCGHAKLYYLQTRMSSFRQTDLKFTATGIKQWVVEYRSAQSKCAKCGIHFTNSVVRRLHFGDNVFAWIMNLYVRYYISNEMICRLLREQFGIWINHVYLINRKYKWCERWKPETDYIWEIVRNSPVIHIDETSVRLSKDKGYVWVFATPHTVFYHFSQSHEATFLLDWLKGYKGTIVTDFHPIYETLPIRRQKCLIHLIRDLNDDLYKTPFDEEYKALVNNFGTMLRDIIETVDKFGLKQVHLNKHIKDTDKFYRQFLEATPKSDLSIKCTKRLKKHWNELWTFLHHDNIPWNNNNAEVAVKAFALFRRGVNGQVSEKGVTDYLHMLTIAQTCRYRNLSFLHFLRNKTGIWENIPLEMLPGFLPFNQARMYVRSLGFQRQTEWLTWKQSGKRPAFIPSNPDKTYSGSWIDWHDWLGSNFVPFPKARTYMRKQALKNRSTYLLWLASGKRPKFIPSNPEKVYKYTGWNGWQDYLHA